MRLKTILNQTLNFKSFVFKKCRFGSQTRNCPTIEVEVTPRKGSKGICSGCNQARPGYDTLSPRRFEHIPIWGYLVFFVYALRRVDCPKCGVKVEGKEPILKRYKWIFLKRPQNLTESQEQKLAELLKQNLRTVKSYLLKEDFQRLWEYISPYWAGKFIDRWTKKVMYSKIEPMKVIAKMVRKLKPLILNWFKAKKSLSSGAVEGLNNKLKLTVRKSYGFRTFKVIETQLYHTLGKLPEPEFTHRFF